MSSLGELSSPFFAKQEPLEPGSLMTFSNFHAHNSNAEEDFFSQVSLLIFIANFNFLTSEKQRMGA